MTTKYDVVIVGAGVAGMTAAIYAKRGGKSVLVLEEKVCGGQIINTFNIANWPGEPGVSGVDLTQKIYHQMNDLGVEIEYARVVSVSDRNSEETGARFAVVCDDGEYACDAIIIAVGTEDKKMEVPGEERLAGHGVSYCATCDGAFYKDKEVAVVGGGNTAFYDALYLADVASKVHLVHRRDEFRADAVLVDKVRGKKNVDFVVPYVPVEVCGEKKVNGLKIREANREEGSGERVLAVEGVFVAVGRVPGTKAFAGVVELDERGYVVAGEDCKTSHEGIFVAGDCRTKDVRQLVTAAGDGAVASAGALAFLS